MICPHCLKEIKEKDLIKRAASLFGKKGGAVSSEAKTIAAKKNIEKRWTRYRQEIKTKNL